MRLYRTGEAAKRLGVTRMTVLRWIRAGKIRAYKIGREYRIPESEIKRILEGKVPDEVVIYASILRATVQQRAIGSRGSSRT